MALITMLPGIADAGGVVKCDANQLTSLALPGGSVGAVLAEQDDEWTEGRRYLGVDLLSRCRLTTFAGDGESATATMPEVNSDLTMQAATA